MTTFKEKALQYVKNSNGGATKEDFIDDFAPIGRELYKMIEELVYEDENGMLKLCPRQ